MKRCYFFLLFMLLLEFSGFAVVLSEAAPDWILTRRPIIFCSLLGGIGGVVYCFRCDLRQLMHRHRLGPKMDSMVFPRDQLLAFYGAISYLFLKAGLLILESKQTADSSELGFYALALLPGSTSQVRHKTRRGRPCDLGHSKVTRL